MSSPAENRPVVFVIDDDEHVRSGLKALLDSVDLMCEVFGSTREFLQHKRTNEPSCLVLDVRLPGPSGLDFQNELVKHNVNIPIIFVSGHGDIPMSVKAMRAGAFGFFGKPFHEQEMLDTIQAALDTDRVRREQERRIGEFRKRYDTLSHRERQVLSRVTAGLLNKQAATEIGLSEVTIKIHRRNMMRKLGAKSLPELVRIADMLGVGQSGEDQAR